MGRKNIKVYVPAEEINYRIEIGDPIDSCGKWAQSRLKRGSAKIFVISNHTVFKIYGERTISSLKKAGFVVSHFLMKDGESHKNLRTAQAALKAMSVAGLGRSDAVLALGGGVVGDLAGFVAALYMRGISVLQLPTTLLAMVDSSTGGKTGVNTELGKNAVGAFHHPKGVLIDVDTLLTLPKRELTAGACEIIKHAAIAGKGLFDVTRNVLEHGISPQRLNDNIFASDLRSLIAANIEFKASIVAADAHEGISKRKNSRKILNFGHTLAHALEKVTNYRRYRHGEAVGYGILFAAELSKGLDFLDTKSVNLLYDVVHRAGSLPPINDIDPKEVFEAFRFDKKNLDGGLQFVLLKGIGRPTIIDERDIPRTSIQKAYNNLVENWSKLTDSI